MVVSSIKTFLILFLILINYTKAVFADQAPKIEKAEKQTQEPVSASFEKIWKQAKKHFYSEKLRDIYFTNSQYQNLKSLAAQSKDIHEFAPHLNKFLTALNVSHTQFYTSKNIEFYFFRSLFGTRKINDPKVFHIGGQFDVINKQYIVREVLDGYPLHKIGVRRGDVLVKVEGKPFHPYLSFNSNVCDSCTIEIRRNNTTFLKKITPVFENPNYSFAQAVNHSAKTINLNNKKIGYVHLWTGVNPEILKNFTHIIQEKFKDMNGIILDLRGGYGGAWYEYIDPFYKNRSDFYDYSVIHKNGGVKVFNPDPKKNANPFLGPMIVLINEGVRSGKEALSYQFKKKNRAVVIGEPTLGAFSAGRGIFNEEQNYFLFLATAEYMLDNIKVEGIGIAPHIKVAYPLSKSLDFDPQLDRALLEMEKLISTDVT